MRFGFFSTYSAALKGLGGEDAGPLGPPAWRFGPACRGRAAQSASGGCSEKIRLPTGEAAKKFGPAPQQRLWRICRGKKRKKDVPPQAG